MAISRTIQPWPLYTVSVRSGPFQNPIFGGHDYIPSMHQGNDCEDLRPNTPFLSSHSNIYNIHPLESKVNWLLFWFSFTWATIDWSLYALINAQHSLKYILDSGDGTNLVYTQPVVRLTMSWLLHTLPVVLIQQQLLEVAENPIIASRKEGHVESYL